VFDWTTRIKSEIELNRTDIEELTGGEVEAIEEYPLSPGNDDDRYDWRTARMAIRFKGSSIQVTMDRYGHLFPSASEELARRLDAVHRGTQPPETPGIAIA
jgi:hypothetical protein